MFFFIVNLGLKANAQCEVNPVANQTVCNNTATTAINFTGTATTFNWTNNTQSIGLAASGTGNIASFTALNISASPVTASITVTPSTGACTGTPVNFTITVNPSPVVNVTPVNTCGGISGGACSALTASGADSYIWSPTGGLYNNCPQTIPYSGANLATVYAAPTSYTAYTVMGTNTSTGCNNTATAYVNYTPPAPVTTPPSVNMCLGDPAVKIKVNAGLPVTPAIWTPATGLFMDPASTVPYVAGTPRDSVWAKPTPAGVYTYQVTTQSVPVPMCTTTTNFVANNSNATVTFNIKNNHPVPIVLSQISSQTLTAVSTNVSVYYKTSPVFGLPGAISTANGWNLFGTANILGTGTGLQTFLTGLSLAIPAGITYGICLQATTSAGAPNLAYSTISPGNYIFNDGACELITGTNIGYSGAAVPAAPTTTPSGFVGSVYFSQGIAACTSPPCLVVVTVGQAVTVTTHPANKTVCVGSIATFAVNATGTGPFTYQWQQSSNAGATYTNIVSGGVFSGVNTGTLTINPAPSSMNGYYFRVVVNGNSACAAATSNFAVLTVYSAPTIIIWAYPYTKLLPLLTTTISSSVSPNPGAVYTWFKDGAIVPGANADTILVNFSNLGLYHLRVTDIGGCTNVSDTLRIRDSTLFAREIYVYPNPSPGGQFQIRLNMTSNNVLTRKLIVYDNKGLRLLTKSFNQTIPYEKIDVDIRAYGRGIYWVEIEDANGKRIDMKRVIIL